MGLDKSIEHGKEHRKRYYGVKAIDCSCRNHGSCKCCMMNRLYQSRKDDEKIERELDEWNRQP